MAHRIWLDEHFWTVNFEFAAGAGLRAAGLDVFYEKTWDGVTPDWTVLSESGKPSAFVEVHTDNPPRGTFAQMRAWHGLVERIKKIPVPVVLQLARTPGSNTPPDAGTAKRIAQDLHTQIVKNPEASVFHSSGYTFLVAGDPRRGGQRMISPLGMHAAFDPPSSRAGAVSAKELMERIEDKGRKYRELALAHSAPLIIAVGAHRFTGLTLEHVDDVLTGLPAPKLTFQFNSGDIDIGEQTVTMAPVPPWTWPEGLDGLVWIDKSASLQPHRPAQPDDRAAATQRAGTSAINLSARWRRTAHNRSGLSEEMWSSSRRGRVSYCRGRACSAVSGYCREEYGHDDSASAGAGQDGLCRAHAGVACGDACGKRHERRDLS